MLTVDDALDALESKRVAYAYRKRSITLPLTQALFSSAGVDSGTHQLLSLIAQETDPDRFDSVVDVGCGVGTLAITLGSNPANERPIVVASDRDALATAWTARTAAINGFDRVSTVCALGVPRIPEAHRGTSLSVCNIPAKAGHPVIEQLIEGLTGRTRAAGEGAAGAGAGAAGASAAGDGDGGGAGESRAAFVIVTPLASLLRATLERCRIPVLAERSSTNHVSVIVAVRGPERIDSAERVESDTVEAAYVRLRSEFPGPVRPYIAETVYGLPEFDGLAYRSALAFDLLRGLEVRGSVAVYGVGQGHLPVAVTQRGGRITACSLFDRDLLALRAARANVTRNGFPNAATYPIATPLQVLDSAGDDRFDWLIVNDDPAPGSIWSREIAAVADRGLVDEGKIIAISRTTSLNRLERDAGRLLRVIDERRMHGFCARLYRRRH